MKQLIFKISRAFKKVDWEKGYRFIIAHLNINTASLVIAILAAYISYRSLDESVKQRESMYKPELFIGTVDFYASISNLNDIKFYRLESDSVFIEERMRPWYRLNNVGMGSALSVYGHLLFNTETIMNFFSKNGLKGVKMIEGEDIIDTLVFHNDTITSFKNGNIADWTVDYVLPLSQSEEESIQYFPPGVLDDIVRAYLWTSSQQEKDDVNSFRIPIELDYKDINGKWYGKNLELTVNCWKSRSMVYCSIRAGLSFEDHVREFGESIEN